MKKNSDALEPKPAYLRPSENQLEVLICIFVKKRPVSHRYHDNASALVRCTHFLSAYVPQGNAGNTTLRWVMATVCLRNWVIERDWRREGDDSHLLYTDIVPTTHEHHHTRGERERKKKNFPYGSSFFLIRSLIRLGWVFGQFRIFISVLSMRS